MCNDLRIRYPVVKTVMSNRGPAVHGGRTVMARTAHGRRTEPQIFSLARSLVAAWRSRVA
jgi:hypothetical protein